MHAPPPDLLERLARALTGQYVIERTLGQGGMGTVFLARDATLDRPVAIKVISPDVSASAELRQRFLLEARTVARLRHPNIVSVYSAGESDGLLWFAMEYVPGESLRDRLQREKTVPADAVHAIVHDLALALDDAHSAGIVHRDVKPENILLDRETGRAMLTDFGVARALASGDSRLTGAGFVLGSPRYMSPEQAAGEDTIDGRSDLYSLGLVAYEMIAGRPVVEAESAATILIKHLTEEPTPLHTLAADVPPVLESVIARALRKKPEERFARGRDMAAALDGSDPNAPGNTATSRVASGSGRLIGTRRTSSSRRSLLLPIMAGVGVLLIGAIALVAKGRTTASAHKQTWLVAPFELQTGNASLEWLREGAVNMLSLTLSQWNDLSVVDYERTLDLLGSDGGNEARRVGLDDARRIAGRASAGTLVMGQISTANDSLFVVARRYDVASGTRIDEARAGAPIGGDPRVVFERIARELLDLAGSPAISVELAKQTTESVEAYRLYLEGLRQLNSWQIDRADSLFAAAIAIDSTFALAYYKRSLGLGYKEQSDSLYLRTADLAAQYASRVAPRQREIILGHRDLAHGFTALLSGNNAQAQRYLRLAQDRLTAVVAVDSTDADAWYGLADAAFHSASGTANLPRDSVIAMLTTAMHGFERAIAADSTFHLAYSHLVTLYQMGVNERSQLLFDGNRIVFSRDIADSARRMELREQAQERAKKFTLGWLAQDADATQAWQSLITTYAQLRQFDSAAATIRRARERPHVYSPNLAYTLPLYLLIDGQIEDARTELRAALSAYPPDSLGVRSLTPAALHPLMGMSAAGALGMAAFVDSLAAHSEKTGTTIPVANLPTSTAAAFYAAGVKLGMGVEPTPRLLQDLRAGIALLDESRSTIAGQLRLQSLSVPYTAYLMTGDTTFAAATLKWASELQRVLPELEARMALDRGDTAAARSFAARFPSPDTISTANLSMAGLRVSTQAAVRARLGDVRGALATYEAMDPARFSMSIAEPGTAIYSRSFLARARLYEQINEPQAAITAYEKFIAWWSGADNSLQGEVREARAAVQRLRDRAPAQVIRPSGSR